MSKRRPSLHTRLLVALISVTVAVLLAAGVTGYFVVRTTAEQGAFRDLRTRSQHLTDLTARTNQVTQALRASIGLRGLRGGGLAAQSGDVRRALTDFRDALQLGDARVLFLDASGNVVPLDQAGAIGRRLAADETAAELFTVPEGMSASRLHTDKLLSGQEVSGRDGNTVFLAQPMGRAITAAPNVATTVILGTDHVNTVSYSTAVPLLMLGAAVTLLACVLVSFLLARRLTRPLREIEETASELASGDLSARVEIRADTEAELATVAQALNAMASELEKSHASQRAFLLSVSHDLRTPLTSIRGYADALADGTIDGTDSAARERAATVISSEARRLERLVRDLLDLSRLDSRQFSLHPRPCDAAEVVHEAAAAFAPAAQDLGIALDVNGADTVAADLDPERLGQIVANLVENALKYATTRVSVSVDAAQGALEVAVADDGPGIPTPEVPHVFERLYTVRDAPGRSVGTGLGLAIVHELSVAMGGSAHVDAADSGGSRFVVRVPTGVWTVPAPA